VTQYEKEGGIIAYPTLMTTSYTPNIVQTLENFSFVKDFMKNVYNLIAYRTIMPFKNTILKKLYDEGQVYLNVFIALMLN